MLYKSVAFFLGWFVTIAAAEAHFVWLDAKPAGDGRLQAEVYFGEQPEPGEPHLIGKVAHTKVWRRDAAGQTRELKIARPADAEAAMLTGECPAAAPASFEADCDYGIFDRGQAPVLLHYYAKHLAGDWQQGGEGLARSPRLALDIVPAMEDGKLALRVLFHGQPAVDSAVVVVDPAGSEHELTSDPQGRVALAATGGRFAVRANHLEPKRSGQRDGNHYEQTWHYATLTLDVPPAAAAKRSASAAELLRRAAPPARFGTRAFPAFQPT